MESRSEAKRLNSSRIYIGLFFFLRGKRHWMCIVSGGIGVARTFLQSRRWLSLGRAAARGKYSSQAAGLGAKRWSTAVGWEGGGQPGLPLRKWEERESLQRAESSATSSSSYGPTDHEASF